MSYSLDFRKKVFQVRARRFDFRSGCTHTPVVHVPFCKAGCLLPLIIGVVAFWVLFIENSKELALILMCPGAYMIARLTLALAVGSWFLFVHVLVSVFLRGSVTPSRRWLFPMPTYLRGFGVV